MRTPVQTTDIIDWLSSQDLISRTVDLLAPNYSVDIHNTVSELLKAIIALSAPSPAALNQGQGQELGGGLGDSQENAAGINNRLVRELASEPIVRKMVGYMLDSQLPRQLHRRLTDVADEQLAQLSVSDLRRKPSQRGMVLFRLWKKMSFRLLRLKTTTMTTSLSRDLSILASFLLPSLALLDNLTTEARRQQSDPTTCSLPSQRQPCPSLPRLAARPSSPALASSSSSSARTTATILSSIFFVRCTTTSSRGRASYREATAEEGRGGSFQRSIHQQEGGAEAKTEAEKQQEAESLLRRPSMTWTRKKRMFRVWKRRWPKSSTRWDLYTWDLCFECCRSDCPTFNSLSTSRGSGMLPSLLRSVMWLRLLSKGTGFTELYAELLHCSNMALLNRAPGEGPQYSEDGVLSGGLEGLQTLARTLQGGDGPEVGDTSIGAEGRCQPGDCCSEGCQS